MPDKIKDEELNEVNGGSTVENAPEEARCKNHVFTGFVGKYAESFMGQSFYYVDHDLEHYFYGVLLHSFEAEYTFSTERTHVIRCTEKDNRSVNGLIELSGDDYWIYRNKN